VLGQIAAVVATSGVALVVTGTGWRYVCPRFVDLPVSDDLGCLAVRDGVAVAMIAMGLGLALTAVGTLELLGRLGTAGAQEALLVTLAGVLPIRTAGGLLVATGLGLLCGSLLVPVGTQVRREIRG
jgi:hypothetical protein